MPWLSGKPRPIAALGFDFDGTLVDSLAAIRAAAVRAAAAVGTAVPDDRVRALSALSLEDYDRVIHFADREQFERFKGEFRSVFDRESYHYVEPFDGAREVLELAMDRLGTHAVFVLTNRRHESVWQIATYLGWPALGGGIHSAATAIQTTSNRKASILRTLAARYPVRNAVAYVGDAAADIEAARICGVIPILFSHHKDPASKHLQVPAGTAALVRHLREIIELI